MSSRQGGRTSPDQRHPRPAGRGGARHGQGSGRRPPAKPPRRMGAGLVAGIALGVVVIVVVALVLVKTTTGGGGASSGSGTQPAPADVVQAVASVPASALAAAGTGSGSVTAPVPVKGKAVPLTSDGKPEIVYIGAEYCPYCATERWPMVVALSRFGTFSNLHTTHSSSTDVFPNTATFSFYGSSYTSRYVTFTPVEEQTNQKVNGNYQTLQQPTREEQHLISTYDVAPYTQTPGAIPFVDFGNRYLVSGASFSPQVLQGLTLGDIAGSLAYPHREPGASIDATANLITAAICELTGDQPAGVCKSSVITAAEAVLTSKH